MTAVLQEVLNHPQVQHAHQMAKESLPADTAWDEAKQAIVKELIQEVAAIVELLQHELAPLTTYKQRGDKVLELEHNKLKHLVEMRATQLQLKDPQAAKELLTIVMGVAVGVLTR